MIMHMARGWFEGVGYQPHEEQKPEEVLFVRLDLVAECLHVRWKYATEHGLAEVLREQKTACGASSAVEDDGGKPQRHAKDSTANQGQEDRAGNAEGLQEYIHQTEGDEAPAEVVLRVLFKHADKNPRGGQIGWVAQCPPVLLGQLW